MATRTVALTLPADYTSVTAAAAGGSASDILSIIEPGIYANEAVTFKANQSVVNNSGGVVVLSDVAARATWMMVATAGGVSISGVTIQYGSNYAHAINTQGVSFTLTDVILRATGAGATGAISINGAGTITLTRVTTINAGAGATYLYGRWGASTGTTIATDCTFGFDFNVTTRSATLLRCRATNADLFNQNDNTAVVTATDCSVTKLGRGIYCTTGAVTGGNVTAINCTSVAGGDYDAIVIAYNGATIANAELTNCCAAQLVRHTGTGAVTTCTATNCSYITSDVASANPVVVAAQADWRLNADGTPGIDSPLLEAGTAVGAPAMDINHNPMFQGRAPCIGSTQRPYQMRDRRRGRNLFSLRRRAV